MYLIASRRSQPAQRAPRVFFCLLTSSDPHRELAELCVADAESSHILSTHTQRALRRYEESSQSCEWLMKRALRFCPRTDTALRRRTESSQRWSTQIAKAAKGRGWCSNLDYSKMSKNVPKCFMAYTQRPVQSSSNMFQNASWLIHKCLSRALPTCSMAHTELVSTI